MTNSREWMELKKDHENYKKIYEIKFNYKEEHKKKIANELWEYHHPHYTEINFPTIILL